MRNRAIGFAIGVALGGLASIVTAIRVGQIPHPMDTLLGAGIWGGIFGGAVALYERVSSRPMRERVPTPRNLAEGDIDGFLASLPIALNQPDGWYPDPSRSFRWRRLADGAWSTDVSDEPLEEMMQPGLPESEETFDEGTADIKRDDSVVDQLERLAVLRESAMLTDAEFRLAKERILGRLV